MKPIEKLNVFLDFGSTKVTVGSMVLADKKIYFQYEQEFLSLELQISPIKLPITDQIVSAPFLPFDGLFGVFDDSLPDGWGRLLVDRKLKSEGFSLSGITPLDRLGLVGSKGLGALCYEPATGQVAHNYDLSLDQVNREVTQIIAGADTEILDDLFQLGGSSGGARPKLHIGFNEKTNTICYGDLLLNYEPWIVKFNASLDHFEAAQLEYAYYLMARQAGIEMSHCQLLKSKSGQVFFGTKRFDRVDGNKLHLHSASGIMHDNFRLSTLDYGHLMDCAFKLENKVAAYEKVFRLAAFNVLAHNRDDHSKNFAFLMNDKGTWQMAPSYDLTFSHSSHGYHSTSVDGEGKNPGSANLLSLAEHFELKNASDIIEQVKTAINNWPIHAEQAQVSKSAMKEVERVLRRIK